jgi:hypothetical protein
MIRTSAVGTVSVLVAVTVLAGPAAAAGDDVATARRELATSATLTRTLAADGFTSTGNPSNFGSTIAIAVDGAGHGRLQVGSSPNDHVSYVSTGVGHWALIPARTRKTFAAGLAYIGKPEAVYMYAPDPQITVESAGLLSGADIAEHLDEGGYTFLSVDTADDGHGNVTYSFDGYVDTPTHRQSRTVQLSDGAVTRYTTSTEDVSTGTDLVFRQIWTYEPAAVNLPTEAESVIPQDMVLGRSAVALKATVKAHARETARIAKSIARKDHRTRLRVRDVRLAAARVIEKYAEESRYPEDALHTRAVSLTGGVALHATDPYRDKVRIATVQVVKGAVVVSTQT